MKTLRLEGLIKRLPGFELGPISMELRAGTAYGLLGPNGAGKTTLLNCLAGQWRLDEGRFCWGNRDIQWGAWRYREKISFVSENAILYDQLTVGQTLRFASNIYDTWDEPFARLWLARLELDPNKRVRVLSKGMRVKLGLIAGLAHGAELLLLDEPTLGLDPDARADLQGLIRGLVRERGACTLISSHLFEDIELVCDEVKILRRGRIVYESSLVGLGPGDSVREIYFNDR